MKLTRKHYKRKIVAFGVAVFISLSLIATGFAAWVLSATAEGEATGGVTVGTTEEAKIELSEITYVDNIRDFKFEPQKDDTSGRVQYSTSSDMEDGVADEYESLSVTFSVTISNITIVENITAKMEALPKGVQAAVDAGYITAPDWLLTKGIVIDDPINNTSDEAGNWNYTVTKDGDTAVSATLRVTVQFGWGAKFNGENPGLYYDKEYAGTPGYDPETNPMGKDIAFENVKKELDTFKATIYEMTYEDYIKLSEKEIDDLVSPTYRIVISASA